MQVLVAFINECLLFRSKEKINWVFGIFTWGSIALSFYALYGLMLTF